MSSTLDLRGLAWVKSTYSDGDGGECVEWSPSYARAHGLVPVREGTVKLNGEDITNKKANELVTRGIGFVPQTQNVFPSLSIDENLEMGAYQSPKTFSEHRDKIFEPGVSSKAGGWGVGLALSRRIVELHDGRIELLETGEGTTFQILLPVAKDSKG